MIKAYLDKKKHPLVYGCKLEDIEGYDDAINSKELYVVHHVLEFKYTVKELQDMNRYWNVPVEELIFVPISLHNSSNYLHKGKINSIKALNRNGRPIGAKATMYSEFGKAFFEHFGIHQAENKSLYNRERVYWTRHGKCRWEV